MDDTIKNPDDVERYLKVSVLGSIPYIDEKASTDSGKKHRKSKKKSTAVSKTITTPMSVSDKT